jgi:hypothetical protein
MKFAWRTPEAAVFASVLALTLVFAAFTGHIWEDYWITFRASLNLATGHGLVYTPGERLHTFTSPLGTLLPAGFSWITANRSDMLALWLFRVVSAGMLGAGLVLVFRTFVALGMNRFSCWLTTALIGFDAKIVDFTINGMETGLLIFFFALTVHGLLVAGPRQLYRIGIGWAGLMWSRPDSCVYIAALGLGVLAFCPPKSATTRSQWLKQLLLAGAVCAVLYLPWFLWAWLYYGTPVPHTITAKGTNWQTYSATGLLREFLRFPALMLSSYESSKASIFMPAYAGHGGWSPLAIDLGRWMGTIAAFGWLIPWLRPATRLFSLVFFLGNFYLTDVLDYYPPWYQPTVAVFGYLTLGCLFDEWLTLLNRWHKKHTLLSSLLLLSLVLSVLLAVGELAITVCSAWELRNQQALIEDGLRKPIGLWLRAHAQSPADTVMLEPLGYIGYYSGLKMLDYPGLASKEMVETRKKLGLARQNQVYRVLKPDWIVLRPWEVDLGVYVDHPGLTNNYDLVQLFDASEQVKAVAWLPGRAYLELDQTFLVYHRKPDATFAPP